MSAPKYDRRKFGWLDRVMFDTTLQPAVRVVAFTIYRHLNDVTGDAWPSQQTMARKSGLNIRTVRAAIKILHAKGYIDITFDPSSRSNTYRPIFHPSDVSTVSAPVYSMGANRPSSIGANRPSSIGANRPSSAQSIGASGPSSMRVFSAGDEGQNDPLSNLNNKSTEETIVADSAIAFIDRRWLNGSRTSEGAGVTIEADPIGDAWVSVKAIVVEQHGEEARKHLDSLTVQRQAHDVMLLAKGSFTVDVVNREYRETITQAWRSQQSWVRDVRLRIGSVA
jgi:hypothetical protein